MLHWLKKVLTKSTKTPSAAESLALEGWLEALGSYLGRIDDLPNKDARRGLADDLATFVATGEPVSVLGEIALRPAVGEWLGLAWGTHRLPTKPHGALYAKAPGATPEMLVRWGKVLAAATQPHQPNWGIAVDGDRHWVEALLQHASGTAMNSWSSDTDTIRGLTADALEAALVADGAPADELVRAALATPVDTNYWAPGRLRAVGGLAGFADALRRHATTVARLLPNPTVAQRVHMLGMLANADASTLAGLAPVLADLATSSSKQVRAAVEPLVPTLGESLVLPLQRLAIEGKPEVRQHALRQLASLAQSLGKPAIDTFARQTAAADKAASVQALITEWDTMQQVQLPAAAPAWSYELPSIDPCVEITPELTAALARFWQRIDEIVVRENERRQRQNDDNAAKGQSYRASMIRTPTASDRGALTKMLGDGSSTPIHVKDFRETWVVLPQPLAELQRSGALSPVALAKVLEFFDMLCAGDSLDYHACPLFEAMHDRTGRPTLLELRQIAVALGKPGAVALSSYCSKWRSVGHDWPAADVWPCFAHDLDLVVQSLGATASGLDRTYLFRGIAALPSPPPILVEKLFELALGPGKSERREAQDALANQPGKEARILLALESGKAELRTIAAQWLQRLGLTTAVPALETAIAKEKNDVAKGALLDALEGLGCPIERYLDRDALRREAGKGLAKGLPKELAWLPRDVLPTVRWRDGAVVDPDVLTWLCVQACKQKSPEPNVMLRKYCAMFEKTSGEAFSQFALEAWLHEDTTPITPEQAQALALASAQSKHANMQQYAKYYAEDPDLGLSVDEMTAKYLPGLLRQPRGSAIASKGLLAIAAACGGERIAAPTGRYLKEWFGSRAAQGKALIAMLAWVDHPSAIQLMLSIGNRFRTKSFQDEALRHAEALAERRGWTLAELADRTMPTAGFDENGVLELSYGPRSFSAHLQHDLSIELRNPDGKAIASLPAPRGGDDEEQAKAAKKALAAARKELKTITTLQTERLYEAMCTERDWAVADWATYLQPHPVVKHLLQGLVWLEKAEGGPNRTFRLLDDGTLTDADDEPLTLRDGARVQLAHDGVLDAPAIAAWQRHLVDYEVKPPFQQLGKGTYALPADKARTTDVADFEGHLLEAFALRGRATKLGYTRGSTEDGGWFRTYEKRFPTLGLTAEIEFTGNPLPETNRTVALIALRFQRHGADAHGNAIPLGDVPKVLLSECYQDFRLCAAEGRGFAPDWQKATEY